MSNLMSAAVEYTERWKQIVGDLKLKGFVYPSIYREERRNSYLLSSLVEYEFRGVLYSRHHVESCYRDPSIGDESWEIIKTTTEERLRNAASKCKEMGMPCSLDDVIKTITQ